MHVKKHLSFKGLMKQLSERLFEMKDSRQKGKVKYSLHDCFMSGFAMMYFQDPSLLEFQRQMQQTINLNNLETMFHVTAIPGDSQLRDVLDKSPSHILEKVFCDYFRQLQRGKHLEGYQFLPGKYLITLDGSQYFSSEKICCPGCLVKSSHKGEVRYSHQILQTALVHPDYKPVIPLAPEQIQNTDGADKQDCEINAGKRAVKKIRKYHPKLGIIVVGDSLYSKQPFIKELKDLKMSFILVAKPKDHKIMIEWVGEQRQMGEESRLQCKDRKGRRHLYQWINGVPLNGNKNTYWVNYFEYQIIVDEKTTYRNSWVTDIPIDKDNVKHLVRGGRSRWKIENETFNTLKNQGYHLEHNFGHGKNHLSMNFFTLNLLAFLMHQIFELTDPLYQKCRAQFSARREYWNQLRCTLRILLFNNWESLLRFILAPPLSRPP